MIYLWTNAALLILDGIKTSMHSHYAFEIYIGLKSEFQMDTGAGFKKYRCLVVNSNVPHQFSGQNGPYALILVHPGDHRTSQMLLALLDGNKYKDFCELPWLHHTKNESEMVPIPYTCDTALTWVQNQLNNFNQYPGAKSGSTKEMDPRIKQSCKFIKQSCNNNLRLSDLAAFACLSESRFRHIFKDETGVTIRQFILNARTSEAAKLIIQGYSKTDAAHEAGFSDSAHLSRTFKNMYGLTLSDLYKSKHRTNIHLCLGEI